MPLQAPWVHRAPAQTEGSIWLPADASYAVRTYPKTDGSISTYHYLLILFLRLKLDKTGTKKWRAIPISQKDPDSEFNKLGIALWGSVPAYDRNNPLDYEKTALAIKNQLYANDINVRVQFSSRGRAPYIDKITKIKTLFLSKTTYRLSVGEISWPAEAVAKFPEIETFGYGERE